MPANTRRSRRPRDDRESNEPAQPCSGLLDVKPDGFGFIRTDGYVPHDGDVYVDRNRVQKLGLRSGDHIAGQAQPPAGKQRQPRLVRVDTVNGVAADELAERPDFERLTAPSPTDRLRLEHDPREPISRIVDLLAPIGKGQRAMIVAPPKAGKTTVMRRIAQAISNNDPDVEMFVLLVDERPEEAHEWKQVLGERAAVVASTFDRETAEHIQTAELVLERAKRRVESGADVVILLDSLTRLARTHNLGTRQSGRVLSGGMDASALDPPKRFFGSARDTEGAGSLTIVATCLVETGSRMDEVIFEEFKGRGNMEIRLDRALAEKRIFPAINVEATGTRNEELLFGPDEHAAVTRLRRMMHSLDAEHAMDALLQHMTQTKTNADFLDRITQAAR